MLWTALAQLAQTQTRCWAAINHMALNEFLLMLHTQLLPFVFLSYPFHLVPNWLQAPLTLEFVQLDSTLGENGALEMGCGWAVSPKLSNSTLPIPPLAQSEATDRCWSPMDTPDPCTFPWPWLDRPLLNKTFPALQTPPPKTQIQGFIHSAFQKPFNVRNSFLNTPFLFPQRTSHSTGKSEENCLSEFKVFLNRNI